ncbi:DNA-directed RNA polymerase II subunit RPB1-like [Lycium ferocissimum]|uniref:DNA-directed RNA polymerase II subunit RPB1-like n=1 Tax=Lycium ferocissimum TaxID=112874 RepID=UPI002814ED5D|nr:DNA-directed RNA polymerase II subunit RPB1-like [Lycium ferocissimum]
MGSLADVPPEKKEIVREIHQLASLGVRLAESGNAGIYVREVAESSIVEEIKRRQYEDPITRGSKRATTSVFWEIVSDPLPAGDCRLTKMKRTAPDEGDGGAKKAPRMSPGPSRQSPSYSIETDPSEDPTEDSYDTDPSEDPSTTPRAEDSAEGGYDTDLSEDPTMTPPEFLTSTEEDSYETDPSEHFSGTTEEEIFRYAPAAPVRENPVSPATSESATDFSCSLSWSPVSRELSDYLYSSDSDVGNSGGQIGGGQTDEDDDGHTSHGSSPGQTRD